MKEFEVFISHAVEDKCAIANEVNQRLKSMGVNEWYSGVELMVGDSIMEAVNSALKTVKYAVVILSPTYLRKRWTMMELQALIAREHLSLQRIFPIWHQVGYEEVLEYLPLLADRFAIPSEKGLHYIVDNIAEAINNQKADHDLQSVDVGKVPMRVWHNTNHERTHADIRQILSYGQSPLDKIT